MAENIPFASIIGAIAANEALGLSPVIFFFAFFALFRLNRAIVVSLKVGFLNFTF